MKQIFILIYKSEINNANGFFERREMTNNDALNLNLDLTDLVWILQPNY